MKTLLTLLALAPFASAADLPGMPGYSSAYSPTKTESKTETKTETPVQPAPSAAPAPAPAPAAAAPAPAPVAKAPEAPKAAVLMPPKVPARPKGTLDTAGDVAMDLAVRVQYFESGQAYYRAYTKGSHTPEENKAFVQFLEDYDNELGIAKKVHGLLGQWLEKKSAIKD